MIAIDRLPGGRPTDLDIVSADVRPLTDAFGTRLDPVRLLAGLAGLGLPGARLVADDDGIVLECDDPHPWRAEVMHALTWLRAQFSPLVQVRARKCEAGAAEFVDVRRGATRIVALAEVTEAESRIGPALDDLLRRLGPGPGANAGGRVALPNIDDPPRVAVLRRFASELAERLPAHGWLPGGATVSTLVPARDGLAMVGPVGLDDGRFAGPHFLVWFRPGGLRGVSPAVLAAASRSQSALGWLGRVLGGAPGAAPAGEEILFDGLAWRASRRPTVAVPAGTDGMRIRVDATRCTACGICAQMCSEGYLRPDGKPATADAAACTRCYDCIEACPTDAIRPTWAADTAMLASALRYRDGWLSRLAGLPGPSFPAPFPPSYFMPRPDGRRPRYVLGLAVMTMQEHAAALLRDGELVGAIEHERLVRVRHAGWEPLGRPGVTAAVDPTIALEEVLCRRPVRALLEQEGITLDDIDLFAVNGLHGRYAGRISFTDGSVALPRMRTGRVVYLPHHLCHAAAAYRMAGAEDAWALTVDGRGDRECAAVWRGAQGVLDPVDTLLSLTDRSIGGVYEGVTRLLGFGTHGQGSVMALAAFGKPTYDLSDFLSLAADGTPRIHESGLTERFGHLARHPDAPLTQDHADLAASLQAALEETALALVRRHAGDGPLKALLLGGGVTLNCRMNERLRRSFRPQSVFAQPGANDAGTALGAALEAWADCGGGPTAALEHAYLGPEFDDTTIETALRRSGLRYERSASVARDTARRLANGEVICWFQGRMEFGPRALGARSIVADPRRAVTHALVNAIKQREPWRPFGPSILAGHEADWLEGAFDTRFMLFTMPVRPERRAQVPAVVHVDGTTRPQVVHPDTAPRYHALIAEFHRLSGVPMVVNTSFNRRGEPIVCTPEDALAAFVGLGADALAIGNFLVERERAAPPERRGDAELAALPGGRRLSLRLTTRCDFDCGHCTLRDQHGRPDRSFDAAEAALVEGREAGCDELVVMRGEAALRSDLPDLVGLARRMGYRFVQLQTNAAGFAEARVRDALLAAGVDAFEVQVLAPEEALHDELAGTAGSFRRVVLGLQGLVRSRRQVLVTVPVLARNLRYLGGVVALAHKLGVRRVQFNFPRPVELPDRVVTAPIPTLTLAAHHVRRAAARAQGLGMAVSTEAFPFCHLPAELRATPDATEEWRRHRIDDLHVLHESAAAARTVQRPEGPPCRRCSVRESCPKTWALYLELVGSDELKPLD